MVPKKSQFCSLTLKQLATRVVVREDLPIKGLEALEACLVKDLVSSLFTLSIISLATRVVVREDLPIKDL